MSDSEWAAMRERDAWMAEHVEGWRWWYPILWTEQAELPKTRWFRSPEWAAENKAVLADGSEACLFADEREKSAVPSYHTDPSAALRLLEKMRERGFLATCQQNSGCWFCGLSDHRYEGDKSRSAMATDATFCESVCEAVRLAVGGE